MKFSEMPYERPDMGTLRRTVCRTDRAFAERPDYAPPPLLERRVLNKHVDTLFTLASVRAQYR